MPGKMNTGVGNRFDATLSLKLNGPIGSLTHWTGSYWQESSKPNLIQRTPHPKPHGYDVSRLTLPDCHPRPKKFKTFWQTIRRMLTSAFGSKLTRKKQTDYDRNKVTEDNIEGARAFIDDLQTRTTEAEPEG